MLMNKRGSHRRSLKAQKGFTMLEIVISAGIFSFAMLSLGLMQMNGIKRSQTVEMQSVANSHVMNMMDMMRSDLVGVTSGNYNYAYADAPAGGSFSSDNVAQWKADLGRDLPNGQGQIQCDVTFCTVRVRWQNYNPLLADASSGLRDAAAAAENLEVSLAGRL